jgi:hypothetical protein
MKKIITTLLLAALSLAGVSCSVQEDALSNEQNVSVLSQNDKVFLSNPELEMQLSEAIADGLKDLKMDFVTLFRYNNEKELKAESERIYKLLLKDMPWEMLEVKDARYMIVTADTKAGRCAVTGVYYLNGTKDTALEQCIPDDNNIFTVVKNVPAPTLNYKLVKEDIKLNDAELLSAYLTDNAKTAGSFMVISSGDKASLYFKA